jgi:hypothetical protein
LTICLFLRDVLVHGGLGRVGEMVKFDLFIADREDVATAATLSRVISKMTKSYQVPTG